MAGLRRRSFRSILLAATALAGMMPCYVWAEDPRPDEDESADHDEERWTLSGTLNRAFLLWDDGEQQGVHSVDNPQDSTGFLLEGEFGSEGWTSGFTIGFDTYQASADSVDQLDWDGDGAAVELPYAFGEFGNERWGEIEVGQTDSATDEIDNFNLAEADAVADAAVDDWVNRFFLRAAGISGDAGLATGQPGAFNEELGDLRWGDFIDGKLAGESGRFVTYRSPVLEGVELSASLGQPQEIFFLSHGEFLFRERENGVFADAALRYGNELGAFRVEGGIGAWRDTTEDFDASEPTEDTGAAGSLGVRHMPTGLNIAFGYGLVSHTDRCEEPGVLSGRCRGDDSSLYVKGGIVRDDITRLGQTAIYGEYHRNQQGNNDSDEDLLGTLLDVGEDDDLPPAELENSSVSMWGAGIVQQIEPVHPQIDDMELYLGYRHYDFDFDVIGANAVPRRDFEDIDVVMLGLTMHWGGTREPEAEAPDGEKNADGEEALAFFEPPEFEGGAPVYDWSGLYIGTQAGYFDIDSDGFFATSVDLAFCGDGVLSGGQVGWNMQRGSWVFGAEPDFAFFDCEEANLREEHYVAESDFLATFRARVGWARDNVLLFATGGPAFLHAAVKTSLGGRDDDQRGNEDSQDVSTFGAAVGGGIEWGITRNLSIKAEGLYLFFDNKQSLADLNEGCAPGVDGCLDSAENFFSVGDGFLFRVGANWRLWSESGETSPYWQRPSYLPVVDLPYDWSGFHGGMHVGYGEVDSGGVYQGNRMTNPPPPDPSHPAPIDLDLENSGLLAGGQAGYDWQKGVIVAGVEADVSAVDWDDVLTDVQVPVNPAASTLDLNLLATVRGRLGLAIDDWLLFVTGGVGFLHGEFRDITLSDATDVFAVGGAVGGGIEWGIAPDLSFKAEGVYLAFDEAVNLANLRAGVTGDQLNIGDTFAFRLGANWRPRQSSVGDLSEIVLANGDAVAPVYDWSGIYGGLHVGFGGLTTDGIYNSSPLPNAAIDLTGVSDVGPLGGGQIGFNVQKNWMVLGVEADVAATDWHGSESEFADLNDVMTFTSGLLPTVRGRVGWAEDDLLFYVTGGLTFVDAELDNTQNDGGRSKALDALGSVAGVGMEWGVTRNLSVKTEGLFLGIDERIDIQNIGTEGEPGDFFQIDNGFVARLGANWRFNPHH